MTKASDPTQDFFEKFPKETLFRIFLNQVDCCVCFKDRSHRYMLCSSSFSRLLGYKTPEELIGKDLSDFVPAAYADEAEELENRVMDQKTPILNLDKHIELSGSRATIDTLWISTSIYPLISADGEVCGTWSITRDISDMKNTEQKLMQKNKQCDDLNSKILHLSTVDELTGLHNRKYFEELVRRNMRVFSRVRGRGYKAEFTIVLMDIDHFTSFCTEYGPQSKDVALLYIADILRSCSRSADDVFRVGNDEFALMLSDTGLSGAQTLTTRLSATLRKKPLIIDEKKVYFTLSYGYCTYEDQLDASELIVKADQDLWDAKTNRSKNEN